MTADEVWAAFKAEYDRQWFRRMHDPFYAAFNKVIRPRLEAADRMARLLSDNGHAEGCKCAWCVVVKAYRAAGKEE